MPTTAETTAEFARLALPLDYARRYLRVIRRCLTLKDEAGQARFQEEWRAHAAPGDAAWFQSGPAGGHRHA